MENHLPFNIFEEFFNHSQKLSFIVEHKGDDIFWIVQTNELYRKVIGLKIENFHNKTPHQILGKAGGDKAVSNYKKCLAAPNYIVYDETLDFFDGTKHFRTTLTKHILNNGKQLIFGESVDITDIQTSKNQYKDIVEKLSELEMFLNLSTDAIQVADRTGKLHYINKLSSERLGISIENAQDYYVWDFEKIFPNQEAWETHFDEVKKHQIFTKEGLSVNQKTGEKIDVEATLRHITIKNKEYLIASVRDISKRKQNQKKILESKKLLEESNQKLKKSQNLISSIAQSNKQLIGSISFDEAISKSSIILGKGLEAHQAYYFEFDYSESQTKCNHIFEWYNDKKPITFRDSESQNIPTSLYPEAEKKILNGKPFQTLTKNISDKCQIKTKIEKQGIKSFLWIPVMIDNRTIGMLGFDDLLHERIWTSTEIELLESFAENISGFIQRKQIEKELEKTQDFLKQTNEIAKVGGWEIDLINNKTNWSDITYKIHELDLVKNPTLEDAINFYREDFRDSVRKQVENGIKNGTSWLFEAVIITAKGNEKWIKTNGFPKFENGVCVKIYGSIQDISDEKKNQKELLETKQLLQQTEKVAKIGGWELDIAKNKVIWSDVIRDIHEVDSDFEPILNKDYLKKFYPEKHIFEKVSSTIQNALVSGIEYDEERQLTTAKGRKIWIRAIGKTEIENGKVIRLYGTLQDITDSKLNRLALEKTTRLLEKASIVGKVGAFETDIKTRAIEWSSMTKYINDVPENFEPTEDYVYNMYKEGESREKLKKAVSELFENGTPYDLELISVTPTGKEKWMRVVAFPQYIDGKLEKVFGIQQDIDELKKIQISLEQSRKEALDSANLYKSLVDTQSVYIVKANIEGELLFANDFFLSKYTNFQKGFNTSSIINFLDTDKELCLETAYKCLAQPDVPHNVILRRKKAENSYEHVFWEFRSIDANSEHKKELMCVGFDVTELIINEKELKKSKELTEIQNQRLMDFAYIISHNIRSFSSNFIGLTSLIEMSETEEEKDEYIELVKNNAIKLEETIQSLNALLKVNSDAKNQSISCNVFNEVEEIKSALFVDLKNIKGKIINNVHPNFEVVSIKSYFESIMLNLIVNAIKYRREDVPIEITISGYSNENYLIVEIADNGSGIDLEKFGDKIFQIGKTFHNNSNSTGVGLFITKTQMETMGGKIEVESFVNRGTIFKLYFKC